jgi:hypothetical protein
MPKGVERVWTDKMAENWQLPLRSKVDSNFFNENVAD